MTTTETLTPTRWYVANKRSTASGGEIRVRGWYGNKKAAEITADTMHRNGVVGPIVVAAPNLAAAKDKAARCFAGEISSCEAASWVSA